MDKEFVMIRWYVIQAEDGSYFEFTKQHGVYIMRQDIEKATRFNQADKAMSKMRSMQNGIVYNILLCELNVKLIY